MALSDEFGRIWLRFDGDVGQGFFQKGAKNDHGELNGI